jgi:glutathione synthase
VRIGFVVNDVATEHPLYTTTRLALNASRRGHDTFVIGVGDFSHQLDGSVAARARSASATSADAEAYLAQLQDEDDHGAQISVDDLDVLVLRYDPAADQLERPWAVTSGVLFGQLTVSRGTLVVNDPSHLANAINKTYFQHFPDSVRPRTLISRDADEIAAFIAAVGGRGVLKPLQGSGGSGVFFVSSDESPNFNQMVEAVGRDGYIVAQEELPGADDGDVRMFIMNGEPLMSDGHHAAFRRVNRTGDPRSNMRAGGRAESVTVTDAMLELVDAVRPKLVADGMFLVGLDLVGDKLMEVNVFSPGGLGSCEQLYGTSFTDPVIDALEAKVELAGRSGTVIDNAVLATR